MNSIGSHALGVDIGGTGIKAAVVDTATGALVTQVRYQQTPQPATPEHLFETISSVLGELNWQGPVGVGFPGVIHDGIVRTAPHLDSTWRGTNIISLFSRLSPKLIVLNDADAATLAEMKFGAGKERNDASGGSVLLLTFGTGIGSGLVRNGILVPNTELGHIFMSNGLEAERYVAGSTRTKENLSWEVWGTRLNEYLQYLESLLSPHLFIIGGGISENFALYSPYLSTRAIVLKASFGNGAGIIGAALAAI